ncbi:MAG: flagellar assembly peptidoglycan hydrolase FlgJ [Oxalobacter sp.]|nr:MAG: flagellar assembly peptidoglycan hydrolase FlgJ [Oxalobacter sp.]
MVNPANMNAQLPVGGADMGVLRRAARENSPEAIKAVAQQFEALLLNMMMKSMREATPKSGLFESEQTRLYMSLLDQQISQNFAKRGMGLADALVRQMTSVNGQTPLSEQALEVLMNKNPGREASALTTNADRQATHESRPAHVQAFQKKFAADAQVVSRESGIPAKFMLGQAALETGWGKSVMVCADGTSSHNLFGIKATGGWKGKVVESVTTEYVNGIAYKKTEKFRAYDSYADSFRDYANLLQSSPRYKEVLSSGQDARRFAESLQSAGYATDPQYADKLTRIIQGTLSA